MKKIQQNWLVFAGIVVGIMALCHCDPLLAFGAGCGIALPVGGFDEKSGS